MDKSYMASLKMFNKKIRVINFNKKQAFSIAARPSLIEPEDFVDYSEIPMHNGFDNIVSDVIKFSEYEWEKVMGDRKGTDFLIIHDEHNTQVLHSDGTCIWKRIE